MQVLNSCKCLIHVSAWFMHFVPSRWGTILAVPHRLGVPFAILNWALRALKTRNCCRLGMTQIMQLHNRYAFSTTKNVCIGAKLVADMPPRPPVNDQASGSWTGSWYQQIAMFDICRRMHIGICSSTDVHPAQLLAQVSLQLCTNIRHTYLFRKLSTIFLTKAEVMDPLQHYNNILFITS